jgi:1,4-dihydroxy-2-naphthoyl-CoA hydrolase
MSTPAHPSFLPQDQTMAGYLGIEIQEQPDGSIIGRMPIDRRTVQPMGLAHGGALIALAETLASLGTANTLDLATHVAMGQEINASLLRPAPAGTSVVGEATPVHRGRSSMVWDVRIRNDEGKLVAICRCSIAIRPREQR